MQLCLGEHNGRQGRGDEEDDGEDQPGSQGLHLQISSDNIPDVPE